MAAFFALAMSLCLATVPVSVAVPLLKLTWTSVAVTPWAVSSCLTFSSMLLLEVMPLDDMGLLMLFGVAAVDAACGVVCAYAAVPKDATTRDARAAAMRVFMMGLLVWIERLRSTVARSLVGSLTTIAPSPS